MTITERIEKIQTLDNYLSGVTLALQQLNEPQVWPFIHLRLAVGHIGMARIEIEKQIKDLKQMKK